MDIIITGSKICPLVAECADYIYSINKEKTPVED
jgi:ATP:corrinoid adenosyltransferase